MKRQLQLLGLLLVMLTTSFSAFAAYDAKVDGLCYNLDKEKMTATLVAGEYTGNISIPASVTFNSRVFSVTAIGDSAFYGCSGLTSVTIPNSVTSIGDCAFYGCSSLTSVNIPDAVTSIGNSAFYSCSALTSVNIPDAVRSIGDNAFSGCSGLTSFTIGKSLRRIESKAFYGCSSLVSLFVKTETPPSCASEALGGIVKWNCDLYVPSGTLSAYKSAYQWKDFLYIMEKDFTGVSQVVCDDDSTVVGRYDINGRVMNEPFKGLNILKMSDGSTRKVWVE